jgi:hypothetical protein
MDSIEYQNQDRPDDSFQIVKPGMVCKYCKAVIPEGNCIISPCNANPDHPYRHDWEDLFKEESK